MYFATDPVSTVQQPLSVIFGQARQIIVALADGGIEVRSVASGATPPRPASA